MGARLKPAAAALLDGPLSERVAYLDTDKWVGYPVAAEALEKMERLMVTPARMRMPNLAILGPPGAGKTHILMQFLRRHPGSERPDSASSSAPIVVVNAPFTAEPKSLLGRLLDALSVPYRTSASVDGLTNLLLDELEKVRTRLILIDEFHEVLNGTSRKQRQILACVKDLSNRSKVAMVVAGKPTVQTAMAVDDQLRDRFDAFHLPPWDPKDEAFGKLLASFESLLPLAEPSYLANATKSVTIYSFAGGTIGKIAKLINRAAEAAMMKGEKSISDVCLNEAGQRCLAEGWS